MSEPGPTKAENLILAIDTIKQNIQEIKIELESYNKFNRDISTKILLRVAETSAETRALNARLDTIDYNIEFAKNEITR